jgi:hypothetical protein
MLVVELPIARPPTRARCRSSRGARVSIDIETLGDGAAP